MCLNPPASCPVPEPSLLCWLVFLSFPVFLLLPFALIAVPARVTLGLLSQHCGLLLCLTCSLAYKNASCRDVSVEASPW